MTTAGRNSAVVLSGTAGRWPAFRAARRGPRGCGPAARAPRGRSQELSNPGPGLGRLGNKASRPFSPGPRAAGPPSAPPGAVPGDAGQRPAVPGVVPRNFPTRGRPRTPREQGIASVLTGTAGRWPAFRAARRGPRGCGPAARGPRGRSRQLSKPGPGLGRAGNKASRPFSPGARAAGPHPAPPGAVPGDAGQRPALPGLFLSRPAFRSPPTAWWGCAAPDRRARR